MDDKSTLEIMHLRGQITRRQLLVGIGMIPRGEVGLIFATIGLRERVFGTDVYAALLLVVLATTLLTPPVLHRPRNSVAAIAATVASVHGTPAASYCGRTFLSTKRVTQR